MSRRGVNDSAAFMALLARIKQAEEEGIGPGQHKILGGGMVLYCNPLGSWIEVTAEEWRRHCDKDKG